MHQTLRSWLCSTAKPSPGAEMYFRHYSVRPFPPIMSLFWQKKQQSCGIDSPALEGLTPHPWNPLALRESWDSSSYPISKAHRAPGLVTAQHRALGIKQTRRFWRRRLEVYLVPWEETSGAAGSSTDLGTWPCPQAGCSAVVPAAALSAHSSCPVQIQLTTTAPEQAFIC